MSRLKPDASTDQFIGSAMEANPSRALREQQTELMQIKSITPEEEARSIFCVEEEDFGFELFNFGRIEFGYDPQLIGEGT
jgi:hypothetical protein